MVEYNMVYPTNRWVSENFIRMKYSDAVANGEVEYTDLTDLDEIIDELTDSGQVTFTTKTREGKGESNLLATGTIGVAND
jgi:hypothetical protein